MPELGHMVERSSGGCYLFFPLLFTVFCGCGLSLGMLKNTVPTFLFLLSD